MKEKIKNEIKKIFTNNTILLSVYILTIEILFKVLTNTFVWNYSLLRIMLSSIIISIIVNSLIKFIKNAKVKKIILIAFASLVAIYALAQLGFYNYLGNYASLNTSSQLGKVTSYISDYFESFKYRYYTILIPLVFYIVWIITTKKESKYIRNRYVPVILIAFITSYVVTLTADFMQNKFQYVSNEDLFMNPSLPNVAVNQFGVSIFGILDVKSKVTKQSQTATTIVEEIDYEREIDDEKINELINNESDQTMNSLNKYFFSRNITEKNEYTGLFKDKNVIVILLESVNNAMVNEEYFPTLYKLYNEGLTFTNNYSPRNNCSTGNNEFSALTSLFTINNTCTVNEYKNNTYYQSLFNLFKTQGYVANSFHNYTEKYYYRKAIHKNLGSTYYGVEDLKIPYSNKYEEWPSDITLVENSFDIYSSNEKFITYMATVTTHQPYGKKSEYGDLYLDKFKDLDVSLSVKRYLSKMTVLDQAMSRLLELLEENGELEDTVLVLFGDHYPYGIKTSELQKLFDYSLEERNEIERTPLIIYNSEVKGKKLEQYTTYMNILPTLANLFDLEYDPRLYMGEDLFSEDYLNIAVFSDGSWQSPYAFYDAEKSELEYINDKHIYTDEEILEINKEINKKISMSNLAIQKNYFSYLDEKLNQNDQQSIEENDKSSNKTNKES